MKLYPQDILTAFEFDKVLAEISNRCESPMAIDFVKKVRPMDKFEEVVKLLKQTKEMTTILTSDDKFPSDRIFDTREITKLLAIENYVLQEQQIHQLKLTANYSGLLIKYFSHKKEVYPALSAFTEHVVFEKTLITTIQKVLDDEGKLRNDASTELIRIRKDIDATIRQLEKAFQSALQRLRKSGVLSDVEETIQIGRAHV